MCFSIIKSAQKQQPSTWPTSLVSLTFCPCRFYPQFTFEHLAAMPRENSFSGFERRHIMAFKRKAWFLPIRREKQSACHRLHLVISYALKASTSRRGLKGCQSYSVMTKGAINGRLWSRKRLLASKAGARIDFIQNYYLARVEKSRQFSVQKKKLRSTYDSCGYSTSRAVSCGACSLDRSQWYSFLFLTRKSLI